MMIRLAAVALLLPALATAHTVVIYSRADSVKAGLAHALSGVYGPALIDRQLPPGVPWRATISGQICEADRVLLMWSASAAASNEVRREIDTALQCRVPVVPVLIDSTPLPGVVADVQAVDWR